MAQEFLDLSAKIQQSTVVERLRQMPNELAVDPIVVELDVTAYCDFECPECISGPILSTKRISRDQLLRLAREMYDSGVKAVLLTGGGEPLRHHATVDLVDELSRLGLAIGMITNGMMLDTLRPDVLAKFSWIRISLDAGQSSTFSRVRPHKLGYEIFDRVVGGITHAIQSGTPRVGVSFVAIVQVTAQGRWTNISDLASCADLSKKLGCHYFNPKAMQNSDHTLFDYHESEQLLLKDQVHKAKELSDVNFAVHVSSNLEQVINGEGVDPNQPKEYRRCPSVALRTLVTPDGVYPCAYHRGNGALSGNVNVRTASFEEIRVAQGRVAVDPSVDCRFHCARHEANIKMMRTIDHINLGSNDLIVSEDWDLFI